MRFFNVKMCAVAFALISFSGCASSLVYSPSLNLPAAPLKKEQGQIIIGGILMPETRPQHSENQSKIKPGGEGLIRYAFSDNFTLSAKGWSDFGINREITTENEIYTQSVSQRGGIAVQGIFQLPSSTEYKFAVIPNIAFLSDENSFNAQGASVSISAWFPKTGILTPYAAVGPAIGIYDNDIVGYGTIGNIGAAIEIFKNFSLNAEVAGIIQVNTHDNITHGIVSPSVSLGWTF